MAQMIDPISPLENLGFVVLYLTHIKINEKTWIHSE